MKKSPEASQFYTDCLVTSTSLSPWTLQRDFFHKISINYTIPLDRFVSFFLLALAFFSVQSLSPVRLCHSMDCSTPGFPIHHQLPSLFKLMSMELVMPSKHLVFCPLLLLPSIFPSITSVVSDSVRPHRRQPPRLRRPLYSPGKNTGVGCHFLLQYMKVKSESEVAQSCLTPSDPMDCSPPGRSVHGIFQARVLEWGAIAFSEQQ